MDFNERRFDKRVMTSKNKWIKAFRTLKIVTTTGDRSETNESSSSSSRLSFPVGQHVFQENTYKKITACDVCREILRGHSRQGLKCKLCKMNVHSGQCQENAPKCQPKPRLLRKQKSASELEVKQTIGDIEDKALESNLDTMGDSLGDVYPTQHRLSTAEEFYESKHMSNIVSLSNEEVYDTRRIFGGDDSYEIRRSERIERPDRCERSSADNRWNNRPIVEISSETTENTNRQIAPIITHEKSSAPHSRSRSNASSSGSSPSYLLAVKTQLHAYSAPHSPQRKKLSLRMKSLSLDSPESTEHVLSCRKQVSHQMPQYNNTYNNQSPQSPIQCNRRFLFGKQNHMCSVDLPDNNEKSSASPSPCPSPKPQRLLPTNIFVVLYNFRSRQQDELDLKAGYTVTVVDTTDPDWWQGKCLGRKGYFPSNYVTKLFPGEKPLQVCHTIQVNDGEIGIKLMREQIVIQVVEEVDGIIMIRTGINDKIVPCPIKYLQDISYIN